MELLGNTSVSKHSFDFVIDQILVLDILYMARDRDTDV